MLAPPLFTRAFRRIQQISRETRPKERECLELVLEPGHFLADTAVDKSGNPLENAWIYADIGEYHYGRDFDTRTDKDGRYRIEDLSEKLQGINAGKKGFAESRGNNAGVDRDDNLIVLDRESAGQIQGVVMDARWDIAKSCGWTLIKRQLP